MQSDVYFVKIKREDGSYVFVVKSKGNDVPIVASVNSYSSLAECEQAIEGLTLDHNDPKK